jgi:hypothetical protein
LRFGVYLKPVSAIPLPVFQKIRQKLAVRAFVTKLGGDIPLTRTAGGLQLFRRIESGVTPKSDSDFQNTPYRNIFRIKLR